MAAAAIKSRWTIGMSRTRLLMGHLRYAPKVAVPSRRLPPQWRRIAANFNLELNFRAGLALVAYPSMPSRVRWPRLVTPLPRGSGATHYMVGLLIAVTTITSANKFIEARGKREASISAGPAPNIFRCPLFTRKRRFAALPRNDAKCQYRPKCSAAKLRPIRALCRSFAPPVSGRPTLRGHAAQL